MERVAEVVIPEPELRATSLGVVARVGDSDLGLPTSPGLWAPCSTKWPRGFGSTLPPTPFFPAWAVPPCSGIPSAGSPSRAVVGLGGHRGPRRATTWACDSGMRAYSEWTTGTHWLPVEDIMRLIDMAGTATAAAYSRSDVVQALNEHQPAAVAIACRETCWRRHRPYGWSRRSSAGPRPAPRNGEIASLGSALFAAPRGDPSRGPAHVCSGRARSSRGGRVPHTRGSTESTGFTSTLGLRPWHARGA